MTQTFAADVAKQVREIEAAMVAVFKTAVQTTVGQMIEPGPSVASTKKAIAAGIGSTGRGKNRRQLSGPVARTGGTGRLPVDTGYLRASFMLSESTPQVRVMPPQDPTKTYDLDEVAYELVLLNASGDKPIFATFSASYAAAVEYGTEGRPGTAFILMAAQRWQSNVDAAVAEVRAKGGLRA
ncbi:hypothetical protein [Antarcticirhabdus aurantiaca]|uniref:Uncharacterized protein n=1 Tax=Antarcticirhabdus aurantiaca TaxID=2606717 RepID=A0ACD4NWA2_9HYPH|nr:hypothetical protein [Antarcticirhabdus aurantiaca]WAJ31154.1 hypothetical protein OXU80_13525 [Jeongeuplla avenae]